MQSLANTLSYLGGSRPPRASLSPIYRAGVIAMFLGMIGLHVSGVLSYADLSSVWASVPIIRGLILAFFVSGVLGAAFISVGGARIALVLGLAASVVGVLSVLASRQWAALEILEHTARIGFPVVAVGLAYGLATPLGVVRVLVALTFLGHGLYALGWPSPRPEGFELLVSGALGLEAGGVSAFLIVVGVLDLLAVVFLFAPQFVRPALIYMITWGFLTSLARPWVHLDFSDEALGWLRWISEFLVRVPHFLFPLVLFLGAAGASAKGGKGAQSRRLDLSGL